MKPGKSLIWLCCCALVAVLAAPLAAQDEPQTTPAEPERSWVEEIKNPTPWMSWGFDQRLREIYANNFMTLNDDAIGHERQFQRYRSRLWTRFTPAEDLAINARLTWEWRNWCGSNDGGPLSNPSSVEWDEAIFDQLNFSIANLLGDGSKLTVGRQDLIFGNGWLVLDGTPLDGSRTIFFDAVRLTKPIDERNTLDLVWIEQSAASDQWIEPFNDQERHLTEQNERGLIAYWTNTALENTQLDFYYIWKHDDPTDVQPGAGNHPPTWARDSDIHTLGARAAGRIDENWKYRAEFAQQFGNQEEFGNIADGTQSLCAWGANSRLEYWLNDDWKSFFHAGYEYLSGDDPSTESTDEGFDPLWARWPQWSELYIYTYAIETRIAETTNLHRVNVGWDADPCPKIHLATEYNLLWADESQGPTASFTENGNFRGQLASAKMIYKFNEYISGHLWAEYFCPGNFYTDFRNDSAVFLRYELMLTF